MLLMCFFYFTSKLFHTALEKEILDIFSDGQWYTMQDVYDQLIVHRGMNHSQAMEDTMWAFVENGVLEREAHPNHTEQRFRLMQKSPSPATH